MRACQAKTTNRGDRRRVSCANAASTTVEFCGVRVPVCGTHARQYNAWEGMQEGTARSLWWWRGPAETTPCRNEQQHGAHAFMRGGTLFECPGRPG